MWFKKKQVKGYLTLILNTGYELIPNVTGVIGEYNNVVDDINYWYQHKVVKVIELYDRDIKYLKSIGYDIDKYVYRKRLGYDDVLELSRKKIINRIPKL